MRTALFLAALLAGCGKTEPRPDPGLERKPVEADVPAYAGLEYVDGTCKRNAGFRSMTQEYRGDAKPEDVLAFYRTTMPVHGWAETGADGKTLIFTKNSEKCSITVGTDSHNKVVVKVLVAYKG
ncbi:MAG: hypothetical protein HYY17_14115 [Planctomycetes bacterium]|nr:hypothetical protein [Planctomycetota bacterium]